MAKLYICNKQAYLGSYFDRKSTLKNCTWLESKELFLYPWDAGVDSGISYESPDQPTEPQQNITR